MFFHNVNRQDSPLIFFDGTKIGNNYELLILNYELFYKICWKTGIHVLFILLWLLMMDRLRHNGR